METRKLSFNEMEKLEGGRSINACDVAGGLVVGLWAFAFSTAWTGVGAAIGFFGALAVTYVCSPNS